MEKLTYLLVAVAVVTVLIGGLALAQEAEMKTYTNEKYGFKVSYPGGWMKTEIEYQGSAVAAFNSYPKSHRMTVDASRMKKERGLQEYVEAGDLQLTSMARYQDVKKWEKTISGEKAFFREYTLAKVDGAGTRTKKIYLKKGDILYTLSFSTSADSYQEMEEKYFNPILEGFELY